MNFGSNADIKKKGQSEFAVLAYKVFQVSQPFMEPGPIYRGRDKAKPTSLAGGKKISNFLLNTASKKECNFARRQRQQFPTQATVTVTNIQYNTRCVPMPKKKSSGNGSADSENKIDITH